jgi:hypothetical protein
VPPSPVLDAVYLVAYAKMVVVKSQKANLEQCLPILVSQFRQGWLVLVREGRQAAARQRIGSSEKG